MIKILSRNWHLLYIVFFFALLSGLFYPFVNGIGYEKLVVGIIMLLFGLYGGIRLYKYINNKHFEDFYMGFICIGISIIMIYTISGIIPAMISELI